MSRSLSGEEQLVARRALYRFAEAARSRCGYLAADSAERQFYLGIEAAAEHMLRPEALQSRPSTWLNSEAAAFREGYLRASSLLSEMLSREEPVLQIPLPHFSAA